METAVADGILERYAIGGAVGATFYIEPAATQDGFGIDLALGAMPFESSAIERSSNAELVPGATLRTCSAEDLIMHKAFAARPQDWIDIEGVFLKQRGLLHWPQIWSNLGELAELKEAPELLVELDRVATRTESVVGPFPHARP